MRRPPAEACESGPLGITLGDIGGIGPEIVVKAILRRGAPRPLAIIGSLDVMAEAGRWLGVAMPPHWDPYGGKPAPAVSVWEPEGTPSGLKVFCGRPTGAAARAALGWIEAGARACLEGRLAGLVTAPISKAGFVKAGLQGGEGHTEVLARVTGARRVAMMLVGGPLRVTLATRHVALSQVTSALSREAVLEAITLTDLGLGWLGVTPRTIAVCALNPHAGEHGTLGDEERRIIAPAVRTARRRGVDATGPLAADAVFRRAWQEGYGAVVAMYHDQGLAPLKMVAFDRGVNVTLGLPIARVSPDHGTAYDIAGRGCADARSMIEAIRLGKRLAGRPNPFVTKSPWR